MTHEAGARRVILEHIREEFEQEVVGEDEFTVTDVMHELNITYDTAYRLTKDKVASGDVVEMKLGKRNKKYRFVAERIDDEPGD